VSRVSPSMAVALLALFVALGGTGYAAARLNGRDIVNGSITGKKLKRNTLGGRQIKESSLGRVPSASDSDQLDGRPASAYLLAGNTAANAAHLDGFDASAFLLSNGTAINASALGGQPPSAFLGAGATAANSRALQGHPASDFLPASRVQSAGPVSIAVGGEDTLFSAGPLALVARCTAGPEAQVVLRHSVDVLDPRAAAANVVPAGTDAPLADVTFTPGPAARVDRESFTALPSGATALQGTATAIATAGGCTAAAFAVAS
jgi:hypothetical protein